MIQHTLRSCVYRNGKAGVKRADACCNDDITCTIMEIGLSVVMLCEIGDIGCGFEVHIDNQLVKLGRRDIRGQMSIEIGVFYYSCIGENKINRAIFRKCKLEDISQCRIVGHINPVKARARPKLPRYLVPGRVKVQYVYAPVAATIQCCSYLQTNAAGFQRYSWSAS